LINKKIKHMFKMKSVLCIVAIFSLALVSCVERIPEKEMPDVDNGVITMVKATVEPLTLKGTTEVGNYKWNEEHTIGIYGSTVGENECYIPVKSTIGDNEAYFFGNIVGGDMTVYMPYVSSGSQAALNGRVVVPAEQTYFANPLDHLMYNSTFLAVGKSEEFTFSYYTGLVKVELHYDIENITEVSVMVGTITPNGGYDENCVGELLVKSDEEADAGADAEAKERLVNGGNKVTVTGFPEGVDATVDEPLTLWVALAPGTYEALVVEVSNDTITTSLPVRGPFVVEKCAIAENTCEAKEVKHDNGVDDFVGENGEFNPKN
jgi:hypothetical protein